MNGHYYCTVILLENSINVWQICQTSANDTHYESSRITTNLCKSCKWSWICMNHYISSWMTVWQCEQMQFVHHESRQIIVNHSQSSVNQTRFFQIWAELKNVTNLPNHSQTEKAFLGHACIVLMGEQCTLTFSQRDNRIPNLNDSVMHCLHCCSCLCYPLIEAFKLGILLYFCKKS